MTQRKPMRKVPMPPREKPMQRSSLRSSKPPATGETQPAKPRRSTGKHVGKTAATRDMCKRSGGDCEVRSPWCQGKAREASHRLAEGQGGKWLVVNLMHSCGYGNLDGCHGYLHQHPEEAKAKGWIVPPWSDPATTEVLMWHNQRQDWFLLLDDGSVELAPWPEGEAGHPDDLDPPLRPSTVDGAA